MPGNPFEVIVVQLVEVIEVRSVLIPEPEKVNYSVCSLKENAITC